MNFMDNLLVAVVMLVFMEGPFCALLFGIAYVCKKCTEPGDCTVLVRGVISGVERLVGTRRYKRSFFPIYQYEYMGVLYEKTALAPLVASNYTEAREKSGTEVEIYINPEDPEDYFHPESVKMYRYMWIISRCLGWVMVLLSAAMTVDTLLT